MVSWGHHVFLILNLPSMIFVFLFFPTAARFLTVFHITSMYRILCEGSSKAHSSMVNFTATSLKVTNPFLTIVCPVVPHLLLGTVSQTDGSSVTRHKSAARSVTKQWRCQKAKFLIFKRRQ
jgi:hypothetical protein